MRRIARVSLRSIMMIRLGQRLRHVDFKDQIKTREKSGDDTVDPQSVTYLLLIPREEYADYDLTAQTKDEVYHLTIMALSTQRLLITDS